MRPEPDAGSQHEVLAKTVRVSIRQGEFRLEAMTMALYLAVVLFTELTVLSRGAT